MNRHRTLALAILPALLVGCGAGPEQGSATTTREAASAARGAASPASEILERALALHLARMEGIENYTLVQTVMGMESTAYFEREIVDGRPRFRSRVVAVGGQRVPAEPDEWEDLFDAFAAYADRTTLRGTETVDDHRTHVLVVDPFTRMPGMGADADGMDDIVFSRATLYLDADSYVLRRMEMEGILERDGEPRPVTVTGRFEDFREVGGMLHPFRTVMSMEGMAPAASAGEMAEARRSLAELRAQMEGMPAAQREMMERMVRPQIEQFERMVGGEGMEMTIEVKDLRVNTGPPGGR